MDTTPLFSEAELLDQLPALAGFAPQRPTWWVSPVELEAQLPSLAGLAAC